MLDLSRTVTVRAEMSRVRRCPGTLLLHRPYRLREDAAAEVLLPADPRDLLPRSTESGVAVRRAARGTR